MSNVSGHDRIGANGKLHRVRPHSRKGKGGLRGNDIPDNWVPQAISSSDRSQLNEIWDQIDPDSEEGGQIAFSLMRNPATSRDTVESIAGHFVGRNDVEAAAVLNQRTDLTPEIKEMLTPLVEKAKRLGFTN